MIVLIIYETSIILDWLKNYLENVNNSCYDETRKSDVVPPSIRYFDI